MPVAAVLAPLIAEASVSGSVFKQRPVSAKGVAGCTSGDPCWYIEQATNNPFPGSDPTPTGQEISAGTGLPGGVGGDIFMQRTSQQLPGGNLTTQTTGADLSMPGPAGSSFVGGIGMTTIRSPGGATETGTTVRMKVKLPIKSFGKANLSFEAGQQFTNTNTLRSSNLIFGVTGSMGGGQAASGPKEEPMQAPRLASARPSGEK